MGLDHPSIDGGLDPSDVPFDVIDMSIMEMYSYRGGAMNALSKYDIYLIQTLYGPGDFTPYYELPADYLYTGASDTSAPVPEPATLLLVSAGFLGLAGFARKKSK